MMVQRIANASAISAAVLLLVACQTPAQNARPSSVIERVDLPLTTATQPDWETGWQLVWSDEFAGSTIDRSKWDFDINCWGGGNDERQCYTDRLANAAVTGGSLVITARQEEFTGPAFPLHMRDDAQTRSATSTKPYTSARMVTRGRAAWQYGRIEVRAKLPQGQGTWPAIWMLPEDDMYGSWAASGEIDIMEAVNLGVACENCPQGRESTILGTLHFGAEWPDNALNSSEMYAPQVLDGFHTFGIVWAPGVIEWTMDGRVYAHKDADEWWSANSSESNAPFDQRFHLVLNLAIGGRLPESRNLGGVEATGYPKRFEIDYVRVWQCQPGEAGGAASACQRD